jgi:FAD/FMN-containing dehydrogenase/Fe-S oxidoreductase
VTRLARALRAAGIEDVRSDGATRAVYSSDASLYRVLPKAVAFPRSEDEVLAAIGVARDRGIPVTARGAGTSVAGNAIGPGLVLDFSRNFTRILDIDQESRTARVQPGVILDTLQREASRFGLRFGPDPSTHSRCTVGGMIGNDACGSRALGYGRTSDNVRAVSLVTGTGEMLRAERDDAKTVTSGFELGLASLKALTDRHLAILRTELGQFARQVSGYPVHRLLPENGFDVVRALVGTEGTLGVLTEATLDLVSEPEHRVLVVLGFRDIATAADAAPQVLTFGPTACEGLDSRITDVVRARRGAGAVPPLPPGSAWLMVELAGDSREEGLERARRLVSDVDALGAKVIEDEGEGAALWGIRENGAGLAGRAPSGSPAWAGWEDAAVPVAALGAYLRDFDRLLSWHGLTAMPFGHFGDGCVHARLDFAFDEPDGTQRFRAFVQDAATLVAGYGGSLSGEHGDGRARSELLGTMYSAEMLGLFGAVKHVFDPDGLLNPGVLVDPAPIDHDLRLPARRTVTDLAFGYTADGGDLSQALHRCTGVGKCRVPTPGSGSVMCPSYAATSEEIHSTRGRARALQELMDGTHVKEWGDPALHETLDLCLSCKGCLSDCPSGVDMATYKSEALHQTYRGRLRPRTHYSLGQLPRWTRLAGRFPRVANAALAAPGLKSLALRLAGIDRRRGTPQFAQQSFRTWFDERPAPSAQPADRRLILFVDSFTNVFSPEVGISMVRVLEAAGYQVSLTDKDVCCALTWLSTGQLDGARRILERTVRTLTDQAPTGVIVGIEPSCTAALRHDAPELLGSEAARLIAARVRTLAEVLTADLAWEPPDLHSTDVVAQPHCHHHAVMGWDSDAALLARTGARVRQLGGCCGLAGNFGMEAGHYEVSVAVAELQLLPGLRASAPGSVFLADGFSCRTQAADLVKTSGVHLAQLLDPARLPVAQGESIRLSSRLMGHCP